MPLRSLAAVLGGLALAAAFEPIGVAALMPPALATLVLAVRGVSPRRAWVPSTLFGVAFVFTVMVWMRAVGTDAWLAMSTLEALFFAPLGMGLALSMRHRAWPVWAALWWVGIETLRSTWPFSGMPFGRLSFATAGTPWAEALPWLGMTGVSLLVALTGTTLAWAVVSVRRSPGPVVAGLVALAVATAAPALAAYEVAVDDTVTVAAVQGDVPGTGTDLVGVHRQVTANHVQMTIELAADVEAGEVPAPDLVVWPENSTAVDPFEDPEVLAGIEAASAAVGVPILVGAMVDAPDPEQVLNQGIVWNPGLGGGDRYAKRHPVPYGEYIPFRGSLMPATYGKLRLVARDMVRGTRVEPLRLDGALVADAICFDVAYDDGISDQVSRGGQLLTVQTSNAMFINTHQIEQQFEISRLRALESGRWVVVAAVNGVSGVIAPDGEVVARASTRTQEVLVEQVELSSSVTPAMRMGVWPGRVVATLVAVHGVFGLIAYRRARKRATMSRPDRPATRAKVTV